MPFSQLTPADKEKLILALKNALIVAEKERSVDYRLLFQVRDLYETPESAPKELQYLLNIIQKTPELGIFEDAHQCALGSFEEVDFPFVVHWLVSRGQQVGAEQAINDLVRYLDTETIELTVVLAIDGLQVKRDIKLGEYEIVAWNNLALSDTRWHIGARSLVGGRSRPSAAIVQRHKVQRSHSRLCDFNPNIPFSIEPALDVLRCVTAVAGAGFRLLHYWFEPPDWAPWVVGRIDVGGESTIRVKPVNIGADIVPQLGNCASRFLEANEIIRQRLRVPLDRLNRSYLAGWNSIDKAIELGIALESLFAPTELSRAIACTIRTCAAGFLGGSPDERCEIAETLKDVYDLRSRAMHAGRFDAKPQKKELRDETTILQVLAEGQRIVGQALVNVILEGEPKWENFDIEKH